MKNIGVLGAFDRHNYGDLLFPLIIQKGLLQQGGEYIFNFYGVVESDLSRYGGVKTRSINELFDQDRNDKEDVIIIAGGDVLIAPWFLIYKYLSPTEITPIFNAMERHIPKTLLYSVFPTDIHNNYYLPFVLSKQDINKNVKIIYNAVGGSNLGIVPFPSFLENHITKCISTASYASVRDQSVFNWLNPKCKTTNLYLMPDSASLISEFFPKNDLYKLANSNTFSIINQYDRYICFQVKNDLGTKYLHDIVQQIEKIYLKYGIPTILCPIGIAAGHEDQIALERIYQSINTPCSISKEYGLFDIMAIISHSSLFAGTSLHGAITAMSFGIPNLGYCYISKLRSYLETWGIPEIRECIKFAQLSDKIEGALTVNSQLLLNKREELINLTNGSFINMVKIIDGEENLTTSINNDRDYRSPKSTNLLYSQKYLENENNQYLWMIDKVLDLEKKVYESNITLSEFEEIKLMKFVSIYIKYKRIFLRRITRRK